MLKQIKLTLKSMNEQSPNVFWGYNLYGALMQKIDPQYADFLHTTGLKPINHYFFSQSKDDPHFYWVINLLGEEAIENIEKILAETDSFSIENHNTELKIINKEIVHDLSEMDFVEQHLVKGDYKKNLTLTTVTPCSFKTNESYCIFPTAELIIKSACLLYTSRCV